MVVKKTGKKQGGQIQLSDRTKKILLASSGSVLVIVLAWWAYFTFTTVSPPDVTKAAPESVAEYLGNPRGLARLNYDDRKKFLGQMWSQFSEGDKRDQLGKAFDKMTPVERQVFVDVAFDTAKDEFVKQAAEFNKTPVYKQKEFVDKAINFMEEQRRSIGGGGAPRGGGGGRGGSTSITKVFEDSVPRSTDQMTRALVDRTSARQRAKALPLFDAMAVRYKERQEEQQRTRK